MCRCCRRLHGEPLEPGPRLAEIGGFVPAGDDAGLALPAQHAHRGGAEHAEASAIGREAKPPSREDAQHMAWAKRATSPAAARARAMARSARRPTCSTVSPPETPPFHTVHPGTSFRISAVVRPSAVP